MGRCANPNILQLLREYDYETHHHETAIIKRLINILFLLFPEKKIYRRKIKIA